MHTVLHRPFSLRRSHTLLHSTLPFFFLCSLLLCARLHCGSQGEFFPHHCPPSLLRHLLLKRFSLLRGGGLHNTAVSFPKQLGNCRRKANTTKKNRLHSWMEWNATRSAKKQTHLNFATSFHTVQQRQKELLKTTRVFCDALKRDIVWHCEKNKQVWQVCYAIRSQTSCTPHRLAGWLMGKLPKQ